MLATGRQQIDHVVDALHRCQPAPMSAMARLATRLATALLPAAASFALLSRQSIRRGRLRRSRRVLPSQTQLTFEIRNLLLRLGYLLIRLGQLSIPINQLLSQSLDLTAQTLVLKLQLPVLPARRCHRGRATLAVQNPQTSTLPGFSTKIQVQGEDSDRKSIV